MRLNACWLALGLLAMTLAGCRQEPPKPAGKAGPSGDEKPAGQAAGSDKPATPGTKPQYAFITNGVAGFWTIAETGARKAESELGVTVTVIMPNGITDQTRRLEDLLTRGTDGIAISPINPENQAEAINKAAAKSSLITHDSDAPQTHRLCYIGMDNYKAGLMCGELARKALPNGGKIMVFIGRLDQDNAQRRRQGCIDAIVGRKPDPMRRDDAGAELKSEDGKYIILGTLTDQFDRAKAKANAEDALTRHPDLAGMVGLFEYNPPLILEALDRQGKLGKVQVIGFDENDVTLQAIKDGTCAGTIVQNPYMYGYRSIEVLNALHQGKKDAIPADKFIDIPARTITKENVDEFWSDLKKKLGK